MSKSRSANAARNQRAVAANAAGPRPRQLGGSSFASRLTASGWTTRDNTRRAEQARLTRRGVLDAARDLLTERGPAAITMRDIAAHAGVSAETVKKAFGTKTALIKTVYDVTLAGDDEPIPMIDRPEIQAVFAATNPRDKLARYAAAARQVGERVGPMLAKMLAAARGGDPELTQFRAPPTTSGSSEPVSW